MFFYLQRRAALTGQTLKFAEDGTTDKAGKFSWDIYYVDFSGIGDCNKDPIGCLSVLQNSIKNTAFQKKI